MKLSCHLGDPVRHLLLLDVAHDHIVKHFLGLTQQAPVPPPLPPLQPQRKGGLMRMMTAFILSLPVDDDDDDDDTWNIYLRNKYL